MSGTLFVVATPIGNLEDITVRALRVLREVTLIAAEDTRRTAKLLNHYGIATRVTSVHEHNEARKTPALLARLEEGGDVALVTDAGTPGISDPGGRLIAATLARRLPVRVIPGPSAVLTALVGSGLPADSFTFVGFPPQRSNDRKTWLRDLASEPRTLVMFEAPHRIRATLEDMLAELGDRDIVVGRELTKMHETWVRQPISAVLEQLGSPRGEYTVVVAGRKLEPQRPIGLPSPSELQIEYGQMTDNEGLSRRAAIVRLATRYRTRTREVYQALERAKGVGHLTN